MRPPLAPPLGAWRHRRDHAALLAGSVSSSSRAESSASTRAVVSSSSCPIPRASPFTHSGLAPVKRRMAPLAQLGQADELGAPVVEVRRQLDEPVGDQPLDGGVDALARDPHPAGNLRNRERTLRERDRTHHLPARAGRRSRAGVLGAGLLARTGIRSRWQPPDTSAAASGHRRSRPPGFASPPASTTCARPSPPMPWRRGVRVRVGADHGHQRRDGGAPLRDPPRRVRGRDSGTPESAPGGPQGCTTGTPWRRLGHSWASDQVPVLVAAALGER
jgi:hypothetical protein